MKTFIQNFLNDESGASAAEYALILAIVGLGISVAAVTLSTAIGGALDEAGDKINAGCGTAGCVID